MIRWLFTTIYKKMKNIKKKIEKKNKRERKVSHVTGAWVLIEYLYKDWFFELNKELAYLGNKMISAETKFEEITKRKR